MILFLFLFLVSGVKCQVLEKPDIVAGKVTLA